MWDMTLASFFVTADQPLTPPPSPTLPPPLPAPPLLSPAPSQLPYLGGRRRKEQDSGQGLGHETFETEKQ